MFPFSQSQVKNFLSPVFHWVGYQVEGIEHVPGEGPAVIVMNHTGWEEILFLILMTPRPLKIVGMRELIYFNEARSLERVFDSSLKGVTSVMVSCDRLSGGWASLFDSSNVVGSVCLSYRPHNEQLTASQPLSRAHKHKNESRVVRSLPGDFGGTRMDGANYAH
jgi:hypothetical protein